MTIYGYFENAIIEKRSEIFIGGILCLAVYDILFQTPIKASFITKIYFFPSCSCFMKLTIY